MAADEVTNLELDPGEVALVIGEEDGQMSVRVVAGSEVPPDAMEMPAAQEIILALAMRLLKDPDFHDDMLDWYYDQQDEDEDEEDEEEDGEEA
ncbi:MAG: hypothetical protein P4L66_00385 [Acetobacteraceae bacterium]|nr:hypothetical protein [Acetobacteraceae bacterium]